jgi:hypothetical protein
MYLENLLSVYVMMRASIEDAVSDRIEYLEVPGWDGCRRPSD